MFESTKNIVFISKTAVHAARVGDKDPFTIHEKVTFPYADAATFLQAFQAIKKRFGESVRIIIAEELSYVMSMKAESVAPSRQEVLARAQEIIPEKLSETSWDYQVAASYYEVAAIAPYIHDLIQQTAPQIKLNIEALEPESVAVARYMEKSAVPTLAVYRQETTRLVVTIQGLVIASQILPADITQADISRFTGFLKSHMGIEVTNVVSAVGDIPLPPELASVKFEKKPLEPMVGMAMKSDRKVSDAESLSITVEQTITPVAETVKQPSLSIRSVGMIVLIVAIIGLTYWIFRTYIQTPQRSADTTAGTPTKEPPPHTLTPSPEASPGAALERSAYSLIIQNGSGTAGEAGRLAEFLQEEEYVVSEIGNADREDYTGILIQHTASVSGQFVKELDKVIKIFYTDRNAQSEVSSGEADIIIIIGSSP